jgi:hypothetical protein
MAKHEFSDRGFLPKREAGRLGEAYGVASSERAWGKTHGSRHEIHRLQQSADVLQEVGVADALILPEGAREAGGQDNEHGRVFLNSGCAPGLREQAIETARIGGERD